MADAPLVSCHMPTTSSRRAFIPLAVRCFLEQTYENRELVVLDDGDEPVEDLLPPDPRIKYTWEPRCHAPLGAKRERLCHLSRGDTFIQWDDDDWSAPQRIATQFAALGNGKECVVLNPYVFYSAIKNRAGLWGPKGGVTDGPAMYTRRFWERGGFRPLRTSAAIDFIMSKPRELTAFIDGRDLFVALRHGDNTSGWSQLHGPGWTVLDPKPYAQIFGGPA